MGAVAGIDGKSSSSLYCPVCHEKSEYMDGTLDAQIAMAIINKDIDKLREYKKKYKGIEWEDDAPLSNVSDTRIVDRKADDTLQESEDLHSDILNYLNTVNMPMTFSDVNKKYKGNSPDEVADAVLNLIEDGRIKLVQEYFVVVRDVEELLSLKEKGGKKTRGSE